MGHLGGHLGLLEALLELSWAILDALMGRAPPVQTQGGGEVNLPEEGEEGGWKRKRARPPAPRGLVGLFWLVFRMLHGLRVETALVHMTAEHVHGIV